MEWHTKSVKEILRELHTTKAGLTELEAKKRLKQVGLNEFIERKKVIPLTIFLNQFKSFLVLILIAAVLISILINEILDAFIILVIVFLNSFLGFVQEYKAEKAVTALKKLIIPKNFIIGKKESCKRSAFLVS